MSRHHAHRMSHDELHRYGYCQLPDVRVSWAVLILQGVAGAALGSILAALVLLAWG